MPFELHPHLKSKPFIIDLSLCCVLLEDNHHYPWVFMVPRRENCARLMDLRKPDQLQLLIELDAAQHILWNLFQPSQINVAAIGNKTPQLHVHVIARFLNDPAWPQTVWEHPTREAYSPYQKEVIIEKLVDAFKQANLFP